MSTQQIAFFKLGSFSMINDHLIAALEGVFPESSLDVIDVERDLVHRRSAPNLFFALKAYGVDFLLGRRKLREEFTYRELLTRTPYYFRRVKSAAASRLAERGAGPTFSGRYSFSFQTQSLFDASQPGLPHFVYTDHTHLANLRYPHFDRNKLFHPEWIDLERDIYRNAALVFTTSTFVSLSLIEDYGIDPEKVVCVFAGANLPPGPPAPDKSYAAKEILFVGRDWERKGGPDLREAFCRVLLSHPDAHLTIVGCRPNVGLPNCTVLGPLPRERVLALYRRATLFCLPSRVEPSAIVLGEAMSCSLPVVSTHVGGTPDRVLDGQTGFLVPPRDVEALAGALIALLDDEDRCRDFGRQGYRLAQDRFSWAGVGAQIRAWIDRTLQPETDPRDEIGEGLRDG